jgi:hypothetical protein
MPGDIRPEGLPVAPGPVRSPRDMHQAIKQSSNQAIKQESSRNQANTPSQGFT